MKIRNKTKYTIYIVLALSILSLAVFRYNIINNGIPKEYMIDEYSMNEPINLDNILLEVTSIKFDQHRKPIDGDENQEVILDLNIKNISNNEVDVREIVESSEMSKGIYSEDYCDVSGDVKKITKLPVNNEINITLKYVLFSNNLNKVEKDNQYKFYISKDLYKEQIKDIAKKGKLYGKCVKLGGDIIEKN